MLFDINLQFVYAMRCIGKGRTGADTFCQLMNLPSPPTRFMPYQKVLNDAVKETACQSMDNWLNDAIRLEKEEAENSHKSTQDVESKKNDDDASHEPDDITDITAAFDGTWQKRGHASKNGVVCATSVLNNKVIDVQEFSMFCHCKNTKNHDTGCEAFASNSGAMEVEGAKQIYSRSLERKVRYTNFLGDGDSRAFAAVQEMKPYGDGIDIQKLECVGHVQKRMGARLRKLKKTENLGGKLGLTDNQINKIQNYYGIAIRQNTKSVSDMQAAVWAMYHHMMDVHIKCPKNSWCKFHTKKENKKNPVPKDIMVKTEPIFKDLTQDHLLRRCLHGGTQNSNESFNNVLWSRVPKRVFVQRSTLQLGMYDAVITFNDGMAARANVLRKLNIEPSPQLLMEKQAEKQRRKNKEKVSDNTKRKINEPDCSSDYGSGLH